MKRIFVFPALVVAAAVGLAACETAPTRVSARNAAVTPARDPLKCADIRAPIYFEQNSAALTQVATQIIATSATEAKKCRIASVEVTGLADASGAPTDLSRQRAEAVARALAAQRLPAPRFVRGADDANAGAQVASPMSQKTEIIIRFR